jgi:hypothetical protein
MRRKQIGLPYYNAFWNRFNHLKVKQLQLKIILTAFFPSFLA